MKNIVIAAGYATRLGELTKNFPKPLLKIGEKSILDRMLDDIDQIPEIDEHIIITNHKFAPIFEDWAKDKVLSDRGFCFAGRMERIAAVKRGGFAAAMVVLRVAECYCGLISLSRRSAWPQRSIM